MDVRFDDLGLKILIYLILFGFYSAPNEVNVSAAAM